MNHVNFSSKHLERLAAYVPTPVANAIYKAPEPLTSPTWRRFPAVVLFTDISGFTPLSEQLSQSGPTGAESLTHLINEYFTRMIDIIETYHGQVVKFSGDAMTVLFPAESITMSLAARRAGECALAMQAEMNHVAEIQTLQVRATLSMKVAIGAGEVLECSIGGTLGRWEYVVGGDPLVQAATAQSVARPGQIIVSPQAWNKMQLSFAGSIHENNRGFVNLYRAVEPLEPLPPARLAWNKLSPELHALAESALQRYIPGAIKARLGEQSEWLAELRRMTVLFVGIGGFDYEAANVADRLQDFVQATQEVLYRYEGSLGKMAVDDKGTILLALFGAPPFFHEDDPDRAVACALAMQAVARQQNLHVSIGITEGPLFAGPVGAPTRREYTAIGDAVNSAARLMQYGRAGTIIISQRVKERIGSQFTTESLGRITLRGKADTLQAHLVKGEQGTHDEFVSRYLLYEDPLVGRKAELEQIRRLATRARSGHLQLLQLDGERGLGKSRLAAEMVREWIMEGGVGYGSRCLSYGQKTPYQAWREILATFFGLNTALSPPQQLARLVTRVASLPTPPERPHFWDDRLPLLAEVLGLQAPDNDFTRQISGELHRNNTFAVIEAILRHQASQHPLLILLEDVHWADELSLALTDHLVQALADSPLFLVLVQRPHISRMQDTMPPPDAFSGMHTLHLEPLSDQESLDLVRILMGPMTLPAEAETMVLTRGQGNPFFLQEITGAIQNVVANRQEASLAAAETLNLPDTLQDVILSRVDRLNEAEKLTLKIASVIGTSFQRSLLSEVHPMTTARFRLPSQLDQLQHKKMVRLEIPAPKWEYAFNNIITQEVVYEGLLLAQRRQLHAAVGAALEILAPDETERLAFHYSRSNNWQKAVFYLKLAGAKAHREFANQAAVGYYSEILTCLANLATENGGSLVSADYWDVLEERAKLYNLVGARDEAGEDLGTLGIMAEALNDDVRRALAAKEWANFYESSGDYDSGLELIERCVTLATQAGDEQLVGQGYNQWGRLLFLRGLYPVAHTYLQRALVIAEMYQDKHLQADCLNNLGTVARYQTEYEVAKYFFQSAIRLRRGMGDQAGLGTSLHDLGQVYYDLGQYALAQEHYEDALNLHRTIGDRSGEALDQHSLAIVYRTLGDFANARQLFETSLTYHQLVGDRRREAYGLRDLGFMHQRLGESNKALIYLEEAVALLQELNEPLALAKTLNYYAWTLLEQDRLEEARDHIHEALRLEHNLRQTAGVENLAVLARIALRLEDFSLAEACARYALAFMAANNGAGVEHPAMVYLTCYQVKTATFADAEAKNILSEALDFLSIHSLQVSDPAHREQYLTYIPEHQALLTLR